MQESHSPSHALSQDDTRHAPLHDDIAQCARDLWVEYGRPADRDLEIWLEAEKRLFSATTRALTQKSMGVAASKKQRAGKPDRN